MGAVHIAVTNESRVATVETSWTVFKKLNADFLWAPAISLLAICPKRSETFLTKCMPVFIAKKGQKQLPCATGKGWINRMGHVHSVEYYSDVERNETLLHAVTSRFCEITILHHVQKVTYHMVLFL
jgi:hypothetical protein